VRSARPSDVEIVPQYQAALAYSGCSIPVKKQLNASPDIPRIGQMEDYYAYRRIPREGVEYFHTLYASMPKLRETLAHHGYEAPVNLGGWHFASPEIALTSPTPVAHVDIPFSGWSRVAYRYHARQGVYRRFINDKSHWDRESGRQYTAENVIVQFVEVQNGPYVRYGGGGGAYLLIQNLTGEGRCIVLRGGAVTNGKWVRWERNALTQWVDGSGQPILLNPGRTWIAVVPTYTDVKVTLGQPYIGSTHSTGSASSSSGSSGSSAKTQTRPTDHGLIP
jgi:hypothetical protein